MKSPILIPKSPTRDLDRISPHTFNMISSRQLMRIKKNINQGSIGWSNSKTLQTNITEIVWQTIRRITDEILGVKGLRHMW